MARHDRETEAKMQQAYIEARIVGESKDRASEIAGYAPTTKQTDIEKHLGNKMEQALDKRGLDADWIARQMDEIAQLAKSPEARNMDLAAAVKAANAVAFLRKYLGNKPAAPQVAIQVNNGTQRSADQLSIEEIHTLLGEVRREISAIRSSGALPSPETSDGEDRGLHEGDPRNEDPEAHT